MNKVFLCLGGNIGNRRDNLAIALGGLGAGGSICSVSQIYETPCWGTTSQKKYLNQVVKYSTDLTALELLNFTGSIENKMGRRRSGTKNEDREIDIDILFFNADIIEGAGLQIPHPRLHLRRFVLQPLNDLCPSLVHPVLKKTVSQLLAECVDQPEIVPFPGKD